MPHDIGFSGLKSEIYARNMAILQRVVSFRVKPFQKLESRADQFLKRLEQPDDTLRFRFILERLKLQFDLLSEEAAVERGPCRLQARIIDLADIYPTARQMAESMLSDAPIAVLFFGIVCQAFKSGSNQVRFEFPTRNDERHRARVLTAQGWVDAVNMPTNVGAPLRGFAARIELAGYAKVKAYIKFRESVPETVEFHWLDSATLDLEIG